MRRLEAEPRVSSVTFAMFNPGDEANARIEAEGVALFPSQSEAATSGSAIRSETEVHEVRFNRVDVNFFRTFEVPILAGRGFEPADIASAGAGFSLKRGAARRRSGRGQPAVRPTDFRRQCPRPAHPLCRQEQSRGGAEMWSPGAGTRSSVSSAISPPA